MIWFLLTIVAVVIFYLLGKRAFYVVGETYVEGISYRDLFEFVCNIDNDHKWYMGIAQTTVTAPGQADLVGRQYKQSGTFGGIPFVNNIQIMASNFEGDCHYISFIGTGQAVDYVANYLFQSTPQGAKFTNISSVRNLPLGYLFSTPVAIWNKTQAEAGLQSYTQTSAERLLKALGKPGTASVKVVQMGW